MKVTKADWKSADDSEATYKAVFVNSLDAILISKPDGSILAANPSACKLFEMPEEEICRLGRAGLTDQTDPNLKLALKVRKDTGRFFGELTMVKKSRMKFPAEISTAIFNNNAKGQLTTMIIRDVTERKRCEEILKTSEAEYRNLFENSLMGISQSKPGGGYIRINKAYAKLYGYPDIHTMLDEVKNDTRKLFSNPGDRDRVVRVIDFKGYMPPTEFELKKRNGEKFWALVSAKQVRDETGELRFLQAEHIDITERKNMEKELIRSGEVLEKLNLHLHEVWENEKSQIALNIHDDLGQKLTALNMDLAWLKSRMGIQSSVVGNKLSEMSKMINETIEGLKEISSFLRPSVLFDLGLIPSIASQLDKFEKQSGIKCAFIYYPEEIKIGNRLSLILYRIIQESLTNIARHSGATTTEISLSIIKNNIRLLIVDNGRGIEKGKINSVKSMGIAGIKERVKLMKGKVLIKGKKGLGTTIEVMIPLRKGYNNDESTYNG